MKPFLLSLLAFASGLAAGTAAQGVTFKKITPVGQFNYAIGISPNGKYVCGTGGTNGYIWTDAGGLQTGFGFPFEIWEVSNDGSAAAGTYYPASGLQEAGLWTATTGAQLLGNPGGLAGCDSFLSHLNGIAADGSTAVGMSWQGCQTSPVRWTARTGLTLMAKQDATSSARCVRLSGNGQVAVGWDQGLPTGFGSTRRACFWPDDNTQIFPATTPGNPMGYGECLDSNYDGSIICGTTQGKAFRWTPAGGLELLPNPSGGGWNYYANGISEDGRIVAGVRIIGTAAEAMIWTPTTGGMRMHDFLVLQGATGFTASDFRVTTGVSADGSRLCGWGSTGAWIVDLPSAWTDLEQGLAGTHGVPLLVGTGTLAASTPTALLLGGAREGASVSLVVGLSALNAPFKGGIMVPKPDVILGGLTSNAGGSLAINVAWPTGIPSGFTFHFQSWVADPAGPAGFAASNGLAGITP